MGNSPSKRLSSRPRRCAPLTKVSKANYKQIAAAGWVFCLLPILSFAEPVRSAAEPNYPPLSIINSDGHADGFSVELLRAALTEMGREVVFETAPWAKIKNALADGSLDVLPMVGRTPEREASYDFTIPYLTLHGTLFIRNDNTQIHGLSDLPGQRIAVMKGDNAEEYVRRAHLSDRIITASTFNETFRMLSDGRADAVIAQKLMGISLLKELGLKNIQVVGKPNEDFKQDFCFAVKKGNAKLLSVLNEGLFVIQIRGIQRQLFHKWMGDSEQDAARARIIIYGGDRAYPPYEFLDDKGRPSGFNIDLARAIAEEMGVEISFHLESWSEIRQKMDAGKIDMASMIYSSDLALQFDCSLPHAVLYRTVFSRIDSPPYKTLEDLKKRRVAVQNGGILHKFALAQGLENKLTVTATIEEALTLLEKDKVDFALGNHIPGLYWIRKNGWKNLRAVDSIDSAREYCFAFQKGNETLPDLFNEGLQRLKETGEYRQIYNKWLKVLDPAFSRKTIIRYLLIALTAIALLAAFVTIIILGLKRQVNKRTAQLQESNLTLKESQLTAQKMMEDAVAAKDQMGHLQAGLKESEQLLKDIINTIPVRVFWKDKDLVYLGCSEAFARDAGFSDPTEVIGKIDRQMVWKDQAEQYNADDRRVIAGEIILDREESQVTPEGKTLSLLTNKVPLRNSQGEIVGMLGAYMDITERRLLEEQFMQAQKMEAVGRLAGGVAHDFNNKLQVILGYTEIALLKIGILDPLHDDLLEVQKAAKHSADLTRQLLAFARKQTISPKRLDLNATVEEMFKMLQRLIGENIHLRWEPGANLWPIKIDPSQVDQILANLAVNARDALKETGTVTIMTSNITLDQVGCSIHPDCVPGDYVQLSFSDNGCGIEQHILDLIFEPFFTTKEVGEGTGLGLATVYGIVKQNNGLITVHSTPTLGTTFNIYLPRYANTEVADEKAVEPKPPERGRETILLVEDEAELLNLVQQILEDLGYTVLAASLPNEALRLAKEYPGEIDLLLTDVIMPEMTGQVLATQLQKIRPDLKCIFMSGYTADVIARNNVQAEGVQFIQKPFSIHELASKIRNVEEN